MSVFNESNVIRKCLTCITETPENKHILYIVFVCYKFCFTCSFNTNCNHRCYTACFFVIYRKSHAFFM